MKTSSIRNQVVCGKVNHLGEKVTNTQLKENADQRENMHMN